jgi:serine/threonine-protein kinase
VHAGKASAAALQESDLVPVSKVVERARAPIPEFAACIVLLVAAALIAVVGLGSPDRSGNMPKGAVTVAGVDPTSGRLITVDLSQPVTVNGTLPQTAAGANELSLGFSAGGVSLGKAKATIAPTPNGQFSATFKTSGSQYLVAGRATGEVAIVKGASTAAKQSFAVKSKQSPWTTIPGAVGIASLLFIAGYPNSLLRAMRRGRKRASGVLGFIVLGGLFGVFAVVGAWLAASKEPVLTTLAASVLVGAVAGVFAGLGGLQLARRRKPVDLQLVLQQLAAAQAG